MATNVTRMERQITDAVPMVLGEGKIVAIGSNRSRVSEIWSGLDYIAHVASARENFLTSMGISNQRTRDRVGVAFSSYITQAKNFYTYGEGSDFRSAALLYYYSFLNLAKAKLVATNPNFLGSEFRHGVSCKVKVGDISRLSSQVVTYGSRAVSVYHELYKLRFGTLLPVASGITLSNLFSYCTDTEIEYENTTNRFIKITPAQYAVCWDMNRLKCWPKVAVLNWDRHRRSASAFKNFTDEFYPVSLYSDTASQQFKFRTGQVWRYTVFEPKTEIDMPKAPEINVEACSALLRNALTNRWQTELYNLDTAGFEVVSPLTPNSLQPMDELLAAYMLMHHLSEIVRYRPPQMEQLLAQNTKSGWLLKGFIEQAPVTVLYRMSNWITGNTVRFHLR